MLDINRASRERERRESRHAIVINQLKFIEK